MGEKPSLTVLATWCGRFLLAATFGYAAASKLADPRAFASDIDRFRLLPHFLSFALATYLPWLELICAASVLSRRLERGGLIVIIAFCIIFTLALASAWWRGLDITCGCFGHDGAPTGVPLAILRNIALCAIALLLLRHAASGDRDIDS